jgi:histone arginine demethylase JMJD6
MVLLLIFGILLLSVLIYRRYKEYETVIETVLKTRNIMPIFDDFGKYDNITLKTGTNGMNIERVSISDMSKEEFEKTHIRGGKPCIIIDAAKTWPCMRKWSNRYFMKKYGNAYFELTETYGSPDSDEWSALALQFKHYNHYMKTRKNDNIPLYIFDENFGTRPETSQLLKDYEVPEWFKEDIFDLCDKSKKPPFRWIIIGPKRSGADMHHDELHTVAWNTLVYGKKRWLIFPPESFKKESYEEMETGINWYINCYDKYKHLDHYDIIQKPGETVVIPPNWWHCVINLEESVAISQNYSPPSEYENAKHVIQKDRPDIYDEIEFRYKEKYL